MSYRRSALAGDMGSGLLHFGLGAFHRAHQAPFTQDAIEAAGGDWGIEAVAMRSANLAERLAAQGHRYTLVEQHSDGPRGREINVIRASHVLSANPGAVIARMADPAIQVVTATVTEKGYGVRPGSGALDLTHPAVRADLANPGRPTGLLGALRAGMAARRVAGLGGITVLSCDNLPSNGQTLRSVLLEFVARQDADLAEWIARECAFPDSMVDRITPASTDQTAVVAEALSGAPDGAAVETEPFSQWVIEDRFAGPCPAWAQVGVQIVAEVAPFELMKLRMLNGAHSLIAYLGVCGGLSAVRDVMAQPQLARLVRAQMDAAAQTLPPVPGMQTEAYADALVARFENRAIDHRCLQIAMDGSQKMPQRIFFAAQERLAQGLGAPTFAFATALWMHHIERAGANLSDPMAQALTGAMASGGVRGVGALPGIGGAGLFAHAGWVADVEAQLARIRADGALEAASWVL